MTTLLAADIGGTTSRFALFRRDDEEPKICSDVYQFETKSDGIHSFTELLVYYEQNKPDTLPSLKDCESIVIAVPGAVLGRRATLPNLSWNIDLDDCALTSISILNDFTAQACACLLPSIRNQLITIKPGERNKPGRIAIIGAGTGLGHACLAHDGRRYLPVPSEAGYTTFAFHGEEEKEFERFLLDRLNAAYIVNDWVVTGTGISLLHEFLTGDALTPDQVCTEINQLTLNLFARFYGRVCRNYCLGNVIDERLILSGGIAIKHPEIIQSESFYNEFTSPASTAYADLLQRLPISLNTREEIGLIGAAACGAVTAG